MQAYLCELPQLSSLPPGRSHHTGLSIHVQLPGTLSQSVLSVTTKENLPMRISAVKDDLVWHLLSILTIKYCNYIRNPNHTLKLDFVLQSSSETLKLPQFVWGFKICILQPDAALVDLESELERHTSLRAFRIWINFSTPSLGAASTAIGDCSPAKGAQQQEKKSLQHSRTPLGSTPAMITCMQLRGSRIFSEALR